MSCIMDRIIMGGHAMIMVSNTVIKQISSLSEKQYEIIISILNEFTKANSSKTNDE